jgi:hypothetical protein
MYPKNELDSLDPSQDPSRPASGTDSDEGPSRMSHTKDELISPDVMEVPDGGAKAWLTVAGA